MFGHNLTEKLVSTEDQYGPGHLFVGGPHGLLQKIFENFYWFFLDFEIKKKLEGGGV